MKHYFDIYHPADNIAMRLEANAGIEDLYELLMLLNENHKGRVTYVFDDKASIFLSGVREQTELVAVAVPVTLILLLVIGMNFTGLQLMSVKRRQRDLAIQMTCGARRGYILGGTMLLTMLTVTAAALLASVFGSVAVRVMDVRLYNVFVTVKATAVISVLGFAWLVGALSCLPSLIRLYKLSPVEIMSEQ